MAQQIAVSEALTDMSVLFSIGSNGATVAQITYRFPLMSSQEVESSMVKLKGDKLVYWNGGEFRLTAKGKEHLNSISGIVE